MTYARAGRAGRGFDTPLDQPFCPFDSGTGFEVRAATQRCFNVGSMLGFAAVFFGRRMSAGCLWLAARGYEVFFL